MSQSSGKISSQYLNIRNQNKNEILEDYVEAINEINLKKGFVKNVDLCKYFGVSNATVCKNIKRLIKEELERFDKQLFGEDEEPTIEENGAGSSSGQQKTEKPEDDLSER